MTQEELLAIIDKIIEEYGLTNADVRYFYALRAVVELHKPKQIPVSAGTHEETKYQTICSKCVFPYPCQDIQVIEKELK